MSFPGSTGLKVGARVLDLSERGLKLMLCVPVNAGDRLRVEVEGSVLAGTVRYSLQTDLECIAGIELETPLGAARLNELLLAWCEQLPAGNGLRIPAISR